ncbi:hypothetical protein R6Q59_023810 [Mikania micrantha]
MKRQEGVSERRLLSSAFIYTRISAVVLRESAIQVQLLMAKKCQSWPLIQTDRAHQPPISGKNPIQAFDQRHDGWSVKLDEINNRIQDLGFLLLSSYLYLIIKMRHHWLII